MSDLGSDLDLKITILILIFKITSFRLSEFDLAHLWKWYNTVEVDGKAEIKKHIF